MPGGTARVPALLLAVAVLTAAADPLHAQRTRPFSISVSQPAGWAPRVDVAGVLVSDRGLLDALESGLPLRFRYRVELWRRELPEQLAGVHEVGRAVVRSALEAGYVLDDGRVERRFATIEDVEAALGASLAAPVRPPGPGRYYYAATLEVETLSASDLDELGRWLRGEARPAVEGRQPGGRAVERGLRRIFVRVLGLPARRYRERTPVFTVP